VLFFSFFRCLHASPQHPRPASFLKGAAFMRSNIFNIPRICSSVLLSHTLSDFTVTQDGYTGLRGSVININYVCTDTKNLTTVLYSIGSPTVKLTLTQIIRYLYWRRKKITRIASRGASVLCCLLLLCLIQAVAALELRQASSFIWAWLNCFKRLARVEIRVTTTCWSRESSPG
jgi:hypothetical protein